jgi:hypothetical protein
MNSDNAGILSFKKKKNTHINVGIIQTALVIKRELIIVLKPRFLK